MINYEELIRQLSDIVGKGCEVLEDGTVEHWTSYPHGSGTTTDLGPASKKQQLAWDLMKELQREKREIDKIARKKAVEAFVSNLSNEEKEEILKKWGKQ